jgi:small-conductance mechanosensitive channel
VQSAILLEIWDRFKEHDIEIPFPQRDVHLDLRSSEALDRIEHGARSSPSGCTP